MLRRHTNSNRRSYTKSAVAPFNPATAGTCIAWYRSDLGITLNSTTVSAWADQSGAGDANRNAVQATAAQQPVYVASDPAYNNKPSLTWTVSKALRTAIWATTYSQVDTVYFVGNASAAASAYIINHAAMYTGRSGTAYDCGVSALVTTPTGQTAGPMVHCTVLNGASTSIYINAISTAAVTGNGGSNATLIDSLSLGAYALGNTLGFAGSAVEYLVYNGAHNATQRGIVMNYLAARYALPVAA